MLQLFVINFFLLDGALGASSRPLGGRVFLRCNTLTCTSKLKLDVSGRSYFSVKQNSVSQTPQKHINIYVVAERDQDFSTEAVDGWMETKRYN